MRVALILLLFVTAGCTNDGSSDNSEPEADVPTPDDTATDDNTVAPGPSADVLPWEIRDCFFVYAQAQANRAAVEADLPEGFTIPGTGQTVGVGFEANDCASGTALNDTVQPGHYASVWVGIDAPTGYASERGAGHFVNFDVIEPNAGMAQWMRERGMPVHEGRCTFSESSAGLHTVDCGLFTLDFGGGMAGGDGRGAFDQWTPGTNGLTYWRTDWATTEAFTGVGVVANLQGRYTDWFDAPAASVQATYGTWDYTNGQIIHPAPPA